MADRVDTLDVFTGKDKIVRRILCVSDGTGETTVVKIQKSTLTNWLGSAPSKLGLEQIQWSIQGFSSVELLWDHTTDDEIIELAAGNGMRLMKNIPGLDSGVLWDPASAGGTGDVILTSRGAVNGASYDILMTFRLSGA